MRRLLIQLAGVLVSIPVFGGVITTQTFNFSNDDGVVQATVTVTVLDNYHGDTSKQDWIYTINNLSFASMPGPIRPVAGLSAFGTNSGGFEDLIYKSVANVTGVYVPGNSRGLMGDISPGFCYQCDLGGGWALPDSRAAGVLPGQSATVDFSWLNVPGTVTTGVTTNAYLGMIDYYAGQVAGYLGGPVLIPRTSTVPEPATSSLAAFALCMFGSLRWWRQKRVRSRAGRTL